MKSLWFKALPLLACMLFAAGCSSSIRFSDIAVTVIGYRPSTAPAQAQLTLQYASENVYPIAIAETKGELYLNGEYIGRVVQKGAVGVPRLGVTTQTADLKIEKPEVLRKILGASSSAIAYRLVSSMRITVSEIQTDMKTESVGQLDANSLRAAPVPEPKS